MSLLVCSVELTVICRKSLGGGDFVYKIWTKYNFPIAPALNTLSVKPAGESQEDVVHGSPMFVQVSMLPIHAKSVSSPEISEGNIVTAVQAIDAGTSAGSRRKPNSDRCVDEVLGPKSQRLPAILKL
ncbi:hypothetical protein RRG08_008710 [Elysia crispata]|uniref:Uncharacterized protein n=1 Tax=Elysia crispata TaxID=231223 RepID=A0AAE1CK93_9GAST|nr:hypothetical protein RRG08_008710 [Elysia crispata]